MKKLLSFLSLLCLLSFTGYAQNNKISITHGPYLQNMGEKEVTVVWISDKPSVGWVELAEMDDSHFYQAERPKFFDDHIGIKNISLIHSVKLTGLQPGKKYRYRVYSQEVLTHVLNNITYGTVAATDVYRKKPLVFRTNDARKAECTFTMVNDIHNNSEMMVKLLSYTEMEATDLVLFNGDMVSFFNNENAVFDGFMDDAVRLFAGEIPMYYTRGNHETRGEMASGFQNYFSTQSENLYYLFRQGPVCFVVLDSGEDKPDSDIEYSGITTYDKYRSEQAEWLKQALQSDLYRNAPFKVIICHIPPFGGWHGDQEVKEKFVPLLNEVKPDIMLSGHLHRFVHNPPQDGVAFPVLVNKNDMVLQGKATGKQLDITIRNLEGNVFEQFSIKK